MWQIVANLEFVTGFAIDLQTRKPNISPRVKSSLSPVRSSLSPVRSSPVQQLLYALPYTLKSRKQLMHTFPHFVYV